MDNWLRWSLSGPPRRRALPPSVQQIAFDDDALWRDLCARDQWAPLRDAVNGMVRAVKSPKSFRSSALTPAEWNLAHLGVVYEVERLHCLLMARQVSERVQDLVWEEPLASLLHGLDVAVAEAVETGRQLAVEMADEADVEADEPERRSYWDHSLEAEADTDVIPEWGRGYAYFLYRRYLGELQAILELLDAVAEEAYEEEE
jgi:hypothetical protein